MTWIQHDIRFRDRTYFWVQKQNLGNIFGTPTGIELSLWLWKWQVLTTFQEHSLVTNETAIIELVISVHVPTMFLKSGSMQNLHQNTLDKVESAIELSFWFPWKQYRCCFKNRVCFYKFILQNVLETNVNKCTSLITLCLIFIYIFYFIVFNYQ